MAQFRALLWGFMDNRITNRLLSVQTIDQIAVECIRDGKTAAERIAEEIADAVAEGYLDADDPDDCEGALDEAIKQAQSC